MDGFPPAIGTAGAAPADQALLDEMLAMRSAAVRVHDAAPGPANRATLVRAAIAYRLALGWGADRIAAETASIHDRLNRAFKDHHHA